MSGRIRRIRTSPPKKRRVFTGSLEQRLRARIDVLAAMEPEDITPELWANIQSLEHMRNWESLELGIQPIGSKAKYTTHDPAFGTMVTLLQREIDRLRPSKGDTRPLPRKPLAVQLEESKAARNLLEARLRVMKRELARVSQELGKKTATARSQERLIEHYEERISVLSRENSNLKARLFGLEGLAVVE